MFSWSICCYVGNTQHSHFIGKLSLLSSLHLFSKLTFVMAAAVDVTDWNTNVGLFNNALASDA